MANPSRSMGNFKRFCTEKAEAIDELLAELKDRDITAKEALELEKLKDDLKAQFSRLHAKWEDLCTADEFADDTVYAKCEKDYNDSKVLVDRHLGEARRVLNRAPAAGATPQQGAVGHVAPKIDEMLKPKEPLLLSMSLEEADEWFTGYKAFFKHNERALANQDVSVSRALLNKSIEAKLSSALRAAVQDTAPITGSNGNS